VIVLRQETNLGFTGGNNVGIKQAIEDGAEAVWLINQDTEVVSGCLDKLVANLESDHQVGAVAPKLSLPNGRVNSLGNIYHYLGFGYAGGNGWTYEQALRNLPWIKNNTEAPYLSGAAMLVKSSVINKIGPLDEGLFLYHEDLEFCWRMRLAGFKLRVVPEAEVIHYYTFASSTKQYYYMERNRMLVWLAYFKWPTIILLIIPQLFAELSIIFTAIMNGWLMEHGRAIKYWFSAPGRNYIVNKRREVKELRLHSDRYLLSYASGVIRFQEKNPWYVKYLFNPVSGLMWVFIRQFIWW
jgi:GT2 family glycosyltransferase